MKKLKSDRAKAQAVIAVLEAFIGDVESAYHGVGEDDSELRRDWYDLADTYHRAKRVLR